MNARYICLSIVHVRHYTLSRLAPSFPSFCRDPSLWIVCHVTRIELPCAARIKIVASSNVNPKVQPLGLQGKGNTSPKRKKKVSLQPRLSSIVDNFFRGREGKFSRLTLSIFLTRSLISRRDSREFPLEFGKTRRPGTNSDCIGIRNEETKVKS